MPYFGVGYGEGVHPYTPSTPFMLDCMVEQDAEDVVDHLGNLLLFRVLWVNVAQ